MLKENAIFYTDLEEIPIFQVGDFTIKIDVRYLSDKSKQRAEVELNETTEVKNQALKELSDLIKDEENLDIPHDRVHLLLIFLRARKFRASKAFDLVKKFYLFKMEFSELFKGVIPSETAHIYAMNAAAISPSKDQHGHTVLMGRAEKWDPNVATPMQLLAALFVVGEGLLLEPESQVNGFVGVIDCKGFSYRHFKNVNLTLIKLCIRLLEDVIPAIPRRIHIVNQNFYINCIYKLTKPFIPKRYNDIIHFHGDNLDSLHEFVPRECLLECFGGTIPNFNFSEKDYRGFLQQFDYEYQALNTRGYKKL